MLSFSSSLFTCPYSLSSIKLTTTSTNSLPAISTKKCFPPFLTHLSSSWRLSSCTFGLSWVRRVRRSLRESLGLTRLLLMISVISRFRAKSSWAAGIYSLVAFPKAYNEGNCYYLLKVPTRIDNSSNSEDENSPMTLVYFCSVIVALGNSKQGPF